MEAPGNQLVTMIERRFVFVDKRHAVTAIYRSSTTERHIGALDYGADKEFFSCAC
jgi:hypothetical protein